MAQYTNKYVKTFLSIAVLVVLAAIVVMSVYLARRNQDIRNRAAGYGVTLTVQAPTAAAPIGSTTAVNIVMNTAGLHASAVQLRVTYDHTKLQYSSLTQGTDFPVSLQGPTSMIGSEGEVDVTLGTSPTTPVIGTSVIVATIRFTVLGNGVSQVYIQPDSKVAATEKTDDVLSSVYSAYLYLGNATTAPTSSPTSSPTASPVSTATPSPSSSTTPSTSPVSTDSFYFKIKVVGLTNTISGLNTKVSVQNPDESTSRTYPVTLSYAGNGLFNGIVSRASNQPVFKEGFTLAVKGEKHVQRSFTNMRLGAPGDYTDLTSKPLQPGDLPTQDGVVDAGDINKVLSIFAKPVQGSADLAIADVNYDGIVNSTDLGLILSTLSTKSDEGF